MKRVILIGILLSFSLYGDESQSQTLTDTSNVQKLITQVKNAPDNQKRELMNQLKVHLKSMNKESRKKAMMKIKKSFAKNGSTPKKQHQESCQQGKHQPKFRHLRRGNQDGSDPHQGQGGSHQGNGQK